MKRLLPVSALLLLCACAQVTATRGASFVDPAWRGPLGAVVVDARSGTLAERQAIETSAVATLQSAGVSAIPAMNAVPPTRDMGESIRRRQIMNTGAQAVLEIEPREHRIVESYMPGTEYRDLRHRRHSGWYRDSYWDDPFYYDPPIVLQEPEVHYEATLYALPHYDKIWTADMTTRGPTGMSYEEVGGNYGRELIERLAKDGLVAAPR